MTKGLFFSRGLVGRKAATAGRALPAGRAEHIGAKTIRGDRLSRARRGGPFTDIRGPHLGRPYHGPGGGGGGGTTERRAFW